MKMTLLTDQAKRNSNNEYYNKNKKSIQAQRRAQRNSSVKARMVVLTGNSKTRAKKNGWEHDITSTFLCSLWEGQEGICALTGDTLSLITTEGKRDKSGIVSLDRIDSERGYVEDNVCLVTAQSNFSKGSNSYEDYVELCKKIVENSL